MTYAEARGTVDFPSYPEFLAVMKPTDTYNNALLTIEEATRIVDLFCDKCEIDSIVFVHNPIEEGPVAWAKADGREIEFEYDDIPMGIVLHELAHFIPPLRYLFMWTDYCESHNDEFMAKLDYVIKQAKPIIEEVLNESP